MGKSKKQTKKQKNILQKILFFLQTNFVIVLSFLLVLLLFFRYLPNESFLQEAYRSSLSSPYLASTILNLSEKYYMSGYEDLAKKEIEKINGSFLLKKQIELFPSLNKKYQLLNTQINQREKLLKEAEKWENWIITNPPSLNIYLHLSQLYYQLKNSVKAQEYFNKAEFLAPKDEKVMEWKTELNLEY